MIHDDQLFRGENGRVASCKKLPRHHPHSGPDDLSALEFVPWQEKDTLLASFQKVKNATEANGR